MEAETSRISMVSSVTGCTPRRRARGEDELYRESKEKKPSATRDAGRLEDAKSTHQYKRKQSSGPRRTSLGEVHSSPYSNEKEKKTLISNTLLGRTRSTLQAARRKAE